MGINNPTTINVSGSPALAGNVILTAGTGVTLSQVGNVITVSSTGGGGGVSSLNSLTGAIVIESPDGTISVGVSGSNVTIDVVDATSSQLGGIVLTGDLGNTATSPEVVSTHLSSPLPVNQGGTGTTTPSLVAGTGITITGTWPDQTIAASGGGGGASVPLWNYPAFSNGWAMNQTVAWDDGNMVGGTQNATYMVPFNLEIGVTASYLRFFCTTTGGPSNNYDIGIYDNSGTLVADIGAQHLNTPNSNNLAFTQGSVTFSAGLYWFAITSNRTSGANFAMSGVDPNLYPSSGGGLEMFFIFVAAPGANPYGQPAWFQPASGGTTTGGALNTSVTLPTLAAINIYNTYEFFNNSGEQYVFPRFALSAY